MLDRELLAEIEKQLAEFDEIRIDRSFFRHPRGFELLPLQRELLARWLVIAGLSEEHADRVARRLDDRFALAEEWDRRPAALDTARGEERKAALAWGVVG